jgi:hypothetical protein
MAEGTTVEDLLAEITARTATARVLLRQDLVVHHARLEAELQTATDQDGWENRDAVAPSIAAKILELQTEIEAARRPFQFWAIGQRKWADLLAEHPPTKDQRRDAPRLDHNPVTFPAAAIAASLIEPVATLEQVQQLEERLDVSQWNLLWSACLDANVGNASVPKSLAAGVIARVNAELGGLAQNSSFPDPSSSEGL